MLKYEPWARHLIEQVCLIFMLGCMLLSSAARLAEAASTSELVWLKPGEMKIARDGSAYCELVLMQGEQPLQVQDNLSPEALAAQCQYRIRSREYREKLSRLLPITTKPEVVYRASAPVSAQCNIMIQVEIMGTTYIAQSHFPLYGRGYDKESFLEDVNGASQQFAAFPQLRMLANRNPLMGREVDFVYTGAQEQGSPKQVRSFINGQEENKNIVMESTGHFVYHFPQREPLKVNTDEKIQALLVVENKAQGKSYVNTCSFMIHSYRYSYPNLMHGLLLFAGTAVLTVVGIIWWRRRADKNAY